MKICENCYLEKWTPCPIKDILYVNNKLWVKPTGCAIKDAVAKVARCERESKGRKYVNTPAIR